MRSRDLVILLAVAAAAGSGWASVGSCRSEALAGPGYRILLERGDSIEVREAERIAGDYVRYRRPDGSKGYVAAVKIKRIENASGIDMRHFVLEERWHLGVPIPDRGGYDSFCFRGHDGSRCGGFMLMEAAALGVLKADQGHAGDQSVIGLLEYGAMKNIGPRSAVGGTLFFEGGSDHERFGVRARYRRWLGHGFAVDFAPGIVLTGETSTGVHYEAPGLIGAVSLEAGSLVGLMVEAEVARRSWDSHTFNGVSWVPGPTSHRNETTLRAGVRGGSFVGAAATVGAALVLAMFVSAYGGGGFLY